MTFGIPSCTTHRRRAIAAIAAFVAAMSAPAATAQAQVSRDWSLCYTGGVASCTDFFLTTTPTLGGVGGSRDGTAVSLMLRQRDGAIASGLIYFSFGFGLGVAEQHGGANYMMPTATGGAQANAVGVRWMMGAMRSAIPGQYNVLMGSTEADFWQTPSPTAWIGGCQSPSANAFWSVANVTCGSAAAMSFQWTTTAFVDADMVQTVENGVYAIDPAALDAGYGGAYCQGPASHGTGIGYDGYDPSNADACVIGRAQPLVASTVPEPGTFALVAGALGVLGMGYRRRRRV